MFRYICCALLATASFAYPANEARDKRQLLATSLLPSPPLAVAPAPLAVASAPLAVAAPSLLTPSLAIAHPPLVAHHPVLAHHPVVAHHPVIAHHPVVTQPQVVAVGPGLSSVSSSIVRLQRPVAVAAPLTVAQPALTVAQPALTVAQPALAATAVAL